MPDVQTLFEVHLTVADLARSIAFYRDTLGLELAHQEPARQVAFFWIGPPGNAMLGLWCAGPAPQWIASHTAFRVSVEAVFEAPAALRAAGVTPLDFDNRPATEPIVFAWMPAASVFFRDPDGHLLEYIAMLADEPRPELGVVSWSEWQQLRRAP